MGLGKKQQDQAAALRSGSPAPKMFGAGGKEAVAEDFDAVAALARPIVEEKGAATSKVAQQFAAHERLKSPFRPRRKKIKTNLNDVEVHVLDIADLRGTGFGSNVAQDSEFEPTRGRVYLDTETYVPRRLIFEGEMNRDGSTLPLTATIDMGDYRELQGLLIPYRTVTTIDGLAAAIDPEVRAQFEQMRRELENMPAQQRQMIESMMADQMKQLEAMMSDDGAPMVIEVVVTDVRVNEGSPN